MLNPRAANRRPPGPAVLFVAFSSMLLGCAPETPPLREPGPRPVQTVVLAETDPTSALRIAGAVTAWKQQDLAFEVGGYVDDVVDENENLMGQVDDQDGPSIGGARVATIDATRYRLRKDAATAAVTAARMRLAAARISLEKVYPADLEAATAERKRAELEYERVKRARSEGAVSEVDLIRKTADRDTTRAKYEQVVAGHESRKAEAQALEARIQEFREAERQAELDITRCTLHAPFSGEISRVFVRSGGYAAPNQPVARLVMMDPIKIDVAVSAETARRLQIADPARIYVPGRTEPIVGAVHQKATSADPGTRTFRISVMVRNLRTIGAQPLDPSLLRHPRIRDVLPVTRERAGDATSPVMVEEHSALYREGSDYFVWAVSNVERGQEIDRARPVLKLRKIAVAPGAKRIDYQGRHVFRSLSRAGGLTEQHLLALGVPAGVRDGDDVLLARDSWLLHPGQSVSVMLAPLEPAPGLYVPASAIRPGPGQGSGTVFVVDGGQAREVKIRLVSSVGSVWRIEAHGDAAARLLVPGARIVSQNVHVLVPDEAVAIVHEVEVKP